MSGHIKELYIGAYKSIHDLHLRDLGQINILTGNNNCGKTSILELLATIGFEGYTRAWTLGTRIQNGSLFVRNIGQFFEGFYDLFPLGGEELKIHYDYLDDKEKISNVVMRGEVKELQLSSKEIDIINGRVRAERMDGENDEAELEQVVGLFVEVEKNGEVVMQDTIFSVQNRLSYPLVRRNAPIYISPIERVGNTRYLDEIMHSSLLYSRLVEILKKFDEHIVGINAVRPFGEGSSIDFVILRNDIEAGLPLKSYGDGMQKAVLLLSAIVQARGGILLIDEFETGIHTSGMDELFKVVLETAIEMDVQVFLTSHSDEAIRKVLRLPENLQEKMMLYTLYKYEGKNLVRPMSAKEAVHVQDTMGLELR